MVAYAPEKRQKILQRSLLAAVLSLSAIYQCVGQVPEATISGAITSAAGAAIPNAILSVKNLATRKTESITASPDGTYALMNLVPGKYEITASATGFTAASTTVTLEEGRWSKADSVMYMDDYQ